jgi:glycosyltransferase involved in cell wall biosynthesis
MNGISVILLSYQDGPALPRLTRNLHDSLTDIGMDFEIIIVDDKSPDDTAEIALKIKSSFTNVRVVVHEKNLGVGATFCTGVEQAQYDLIAYLDGDAQYESEDLKEMTKLISSADIVSGIRVERADKIHRNAISAIYNHLIRKIFGLRVSDVNSGIKLYRKDLLHEIRPILSQGPFYDAEILIKANALNKKIAEIPVKHYPRIHGKARGASPHSIVRTVKQITDDRFEEFHQSGFSARFYIWFLKLCVKSSRNQ